MSKITPQRVRVWHAGVAASSPAIAARCYRVLHAVLATATNEGAYLRNPCQVRGAGTDNSAERPLVIAEDVEALAAAMPEHLRVFVLLAFWAGLRLGELIALEHRDVDLDPENGTGTVRIERQQQDYRRQVVVGPPKADSVRTVNLPAPAVVALADHLEQRPLALPSARVFIRPDGEVLRGFDIHRHWVKARAAVGIDNLHIHDLRHAGLTLAAQSGATLAEVMRRAGHKSSRAALIYQHAAADRDADIAAKMATQATRATSLRARSGHAGLVDLEPTAAKHQNRRSEGAAGGPRSHDHRLKRTLLFH